MANDPISITYNVVDKKGNFLRPHSFLMTENISKNGYINSVITVGANNSISVEDETKLGEIAKRNLVRGSDPGVIEDEDMTPDEKLALARKNPKYNKHYNLSLSDDKKYLVVEVKETPWYYPDPYIKTLKADFGLDNDVLVKKGEVPHGNDKTINSRVSTKSYIGGTLDYDEVELETGDKINIPIGSVHVQEKSAGFWSSDRPWF